MSATELYAVEAAANVVSALLASVEGAATQWEAITHKAAIRMLGRQIGEANGPEAMRAVLDLAIGEGSEQDKRRAIVLEAWDGIPGWDLGAA